MASSPDENTEIALNVTRTRVTVLAFNLTIIAFLLPIARSPGAPAGQPAAAQLTSSVALFMGFCLTLLGLSLLLSSQNWDVKGRSRPWPFIVGTVTTYLALSQTITAFMHQYLPEIRTALEASRLAVGGSPQNLGRLGALGDASLLVLLAMGAALWVLVTYVAPLYACSKSPVGAGRRWAVAGYYVALLVPINWVYASAWHVQYVSLDEPVNLVALFALQFIQPALWFL